jgi:type I restriction enzyme R subunit
MPDDSVLHSEWLTRKRIIDPKIKAAGWKIVRFNERKPLSDYDRCAIEEYPTENGPADYALCAGGRILGIVEAKKLTLGPQNVLTQAERYSKGATANPLNYSGYRVPFLYSTNGEIIWHHDVRHAASRSRKVARFHTPEALEEFMSRNTEAACARLLATPNTHQRLRDYQRDANEAVERAIADHKRHMLLAMATGTGKTFTMVNQVYRLMKAGVATRILFLVDRRALAAQAVRAFCAFDPEPGLKFDQLYELYSQRFFRDDLDDDRTYDPKVLPTQYLLNPQAGNAFVYISTIQRMTVNLFGRGAAYGGEDDEIDEDAGEIDIPIHAFDLVIADECHRGYTAQVEAIWRATLDHFDATKIGLTATPAAHTTGYFKDIVYRYEYERAVREGYLVDYDVVAIDSEVRLHGAFIEEGETVGFVNTETGAEQLDLLEAERQYDTTQIEQEVTVPDSNIKILEEIRKYTDAHEKEYGNFPKTLIFAVNDLPHTSHADQLVDKARDVFGRGDSFVQKITGHADRPLQRIREFRNRPLPGVVVTVDMLSTGVDIPDLEFIVFLRPVKSRILFEQMLGRGTRRGEKVAGKSKFVVFDCFNGTLMEYFRKSTAITAEFQVGAPRTIIEIIEDIWANRDRDYNTRCLVKRLQRIDKEMSGEAREAFAAWIPGGDMASYARDLPERLRQDFAGAMSLLRDPAFQKLLQDYQRKQRTFVVAYPVEDTVTSAELWGDLKPDDYLKAFSVYVRNNRDQVEVLHVLLDHPRNWNPETLTGLRHALLVAPNKFSEEKLQKAHERCYHKALVDIISMVKHAAREEEPLLTAEERVDRAMRSLRRGRAFTPEQEQWFEYIRQHLVVNLSIGPEDLDTLPVFSDRGGLGRARKVFGPELDDLIRQLNERIAA